MVFKELCFTVTGHAEQAFIGVNRHFVDDEHNAVMGVINENFIFFFRFLESFQGPDTFPAVGENLINNTNG